MGRFGKVSHEHYSLISNLAWPLIQVALVIRTFCLRVGLFIWSKMSSFSSSSILAAKQFVLKKCIFIEHNFY